MREHALLAIAAVAAVTSLSVSALAEIDDEEAPLPLLEGGSDADEDAIAPAHLDSSVTDVALAERGPDGVCLAGDHEGIAEGSARTAFGVICDALRKAGAPVAGVTTRADAAANVYRMDVSRLDRKVILRITHESPVGMPRDSRSLTLNHLDEVLIAADRVAEALVHNKSIDETAKVDTLVGDETRQYDKKSGETYFGFGLTGFAIPAAGVYSGAGIELPGFYETPRMALGGSLRVALTGGSESSGKEATFGSLTIGGRYFLTGGDVSPYLGGGMGFDWIRIAQREGASYFEGKSEGFGAFAEAGVEMLRLHRTRFLLGLRVDVPFFSTATDPHGPPSWLSGSQPEYEERTKYAIPITLNATFMPFKL